MNTKGSFALTPGPNQPGTLGEEMAALDKYFALPTATRRRWPKTAWRLARESAMPHTRRARLDDLIGALAPTQYAPTPRNLQVSDDCSITVRRIARRKRAR